MNLRLWQRLIIALVFVSGISLVQAKQDELSALYNAEPNNTHTQVVRVVNPADFSAFFLLLMADVDGQGNLIQERGYQLACDTSLSNDKQLSVLLGLGLEKDKIWALELLGINDSRVVNSGYQTRPTLSCTRQGIEDLYVVRFPDQSQRYFVSYSNSRDFHMLGCQGLFDALEFELSEATEVDYELAQTFFNLSDDNDIHCRAGTGVGRYLWHSVSPYFWHTCGVRGNQSLACWGYNNSGQSSVPADLGPVLAVSTGYSHSCAIKADKSVACWGRNDYGQSDVPADLGEVLSLDSAGYHNCAIKADQSLACWGRNAEGQSTVPADLGGVLSVAAGYYFTCAIKVNNNTVCWGQNNYEQTSVPANLGLVISISAGVYHACAIKADKTLACWGYNYYGQIEVPAGLGQVKTLSAVGHHTCVITADGATQCWGRNAEGQNDVPANLGEPLSIHTGVYHTCAIKADKSLQCWGYNDYGQSDVPSL